MRLAVTDNKQYDLPGDLTGAVKLMQVWDAEPIDNQTGFPISEAKAVIIGGTDGQADAVLRLFPKAVRFDSSQSASVEVISDRLRRLGEIQHMIWFAPQLQLILTFMIKKRGAANFQSGQSSYRPRVWKRAARDDGDYAPSTAYHPI